MHKEYVLITGASSGIGAETSRLLSHTYNLILCGRDEERLNRVKEKCEPGDHYIWQFDLSNVRGIESSLSCFLVEKGIKVQCFVHCAGMMKNVPLKMLSVELMTDTYYTNAVSAVLLTKVLTGKKTNNKMLRNAVFISSNISNFGAKAHSAYGASKAALDGLMKSLAMELAPDVRINSILPGGIKTALTSHIFEDDELVNKMEASYPLGLGTSCDIAGVVEFLLSDKSRWITGQQITVDGGRTVNLTV